jgi:hypothetical protein
MYGNVPASLLWTEQPPSVRLVWISLLVLADVKTGAVAESTAQIAQHAAVSLEECVAALDVLGPLGFDRIHVVDERLTFRARGYGLSRRQA